MSNTGEVVVIAGASGGVGRAAARRFGTKGVSPQYELAKRRGMVLAGLGAEAAAAAAAALRYGN